jgi:hypothetical protein
MKAKILLFLNAMLIPTVLSAQNDESHKNKKEVDEKDLKTRIDVQRIEVTI